MSEYPVDELGPSARDTMIELKWRPVMQKSATVLCFSNYNA